MVNFKNSISDPEIVKSGVSQGSILGPLLFNLFMNDIPLEMKRGALGMYADDSTVSVSGKTTKEVEPTLNISARQNATWCIENKNCQHRKNKASSSHDTAKTFDAEEN